MKHTVWFVVTGPNGAAVKTHSFGHMPDRAESDALEQASSRWALGLGRHRVDVYLPGTDVFRAADSKIVFYGPERREYEQRDARDFPHRYE